ncbi:MAG: MBL fold metallo-hydrolase [Bacteroidales bacterium]|nr:MBL fold metallo-hydrolase [Bacteroidales bacterium]
MIHVKVFEFNQFPVNTYLLWDETNEAVLIDCGCIFPEEKNELTDYINTHHLSIKYLLNTHLHLDHAIGNNFFFKQYGLKPLVHQDDVTKLPTIAQQGIPFGIKITEPDVEAERYLKAGDVIHFGNSKLEVLHVPGHSPGSIVFYSPDDHFIISGDVLFRQSIGRTDLWGGDRNLLIQGIRNKLLTLPDDTIVYPGHGPTTTIGYEKKHNPYL